MWSRLRFVRVRSSSASGTPKKTGPTASTRRACWRTLACRMRSSSTAKFVRRIIRLTCVKSFRQGLQRLVLSDVSLHNMRMFIFLCARTRLPRTGTALDHTQRRHATVFIFLFSTRLSSHYSGVKFFQVPSWCFAQQPRSPARTPSTRRRRDWAPRTAHTQATRRLNNRTWRVVHTLATHHFDRTTRRVTRTPQRIFSYISRSIVRPPICPCCPPQHPRAIYPHFASHLHSCWALRISSPWTFLSTTASAPPHSLQSHSSNAHHHSFTSVHPNSQKRIEMKPPHPPTEPRPMMTLMSKTTVKTRNESPPSALMPFGLCRPRAIMFSHQKTEYRHHKPAIL